MAALSGVPSVQSEAEPFKVKLAFCRVKLADVQSDPGGNKLESVNIGNNQCAK